MEEVSETHARETFISTFCEIDSITGLNAKDFFLQWFKFLLALQNFHWPHHHKNKIK